VCADDHGELYVICDGHGGRHFLEAQLDDYGNYVGFKLIG
jgi:hypothetical protein